MMVSQKFNEVRRNHKGGVTMAQQQVNHWLNGGLDFMWLEITKKCNLRCVHCYASSSPYLPLLGKMTKEDWQRVLDEGIQLGCRRVQFIGGEPTLHPHLFELIQYAKDAGYEFIEVFTNGTILNDQKLQRLKELGVHLAFSVYADSPDIHDKITQGKGSFYKTLGNIKKAVELGIPVRAGVIVMNGLNSHVVESTLSMLKELGVQNVKTDRVRGIGRGSELNPNQDPFAELCGECWKGNIRIDADGKASPCVMSWFYETGEISQGLAGVLRSPSLLSFRKEMAKRSNNGGKQIVNCNPPCPVLCPPDEKCDPCGPICDPCQP